MITNQNCDTTLITTNLCISSKLVNQSINTVRTRSSTQQHSHTFFSSDVNRPAYMLEAGTTSSFILQVPLHPRTIAFL